MSSSTINLSETLDINGRTVRRYFVIRKDAKKNPKAFRDKKTNYEVERMTARDEHVCAAPLCPYFTNKIDAKTVYAVVTDPTLPSKGFVAGRHLPGTAKFHAECVPEPAQLMAATLIPKES